MMRVLVKRRQTVDDPLSIGYMPNTAWNDTNWTSERFVKLDREGRAARGATPRFAYLSK
ncbi:hypothetical protein [Roseovarius sp. Pro17]|uniref:hypothetical protein n=1 Tax=Roseovarius sp. Pro17 TaxID=3108175 RepID=UPI002D78225E|nr:hypothetical protein [Roseovarius sp. Pro17]